MKLCALIVTAIVAGALNVAFGAGAAKSTGNISPFTDGGGSGYDLICPLFTILDFGDGFLEYCNAYRTSCNDIPDAGYGLFDPEPAPCDCPQIDGCQKVFGYNALYDRVKPLPTRVPSDGPLPGLNKNIVISKSVPGYFVNDEEPVYVRVLEMVYVDKDAPQKTRSFILGLEMKSPLTGIEGLAEIKDVKPTNLPFVYTIQRPSQAILIIRALGVTSGKEKQPKVATTGPSKAGN
jgi:hypothetical protein